MARQKKSAKNLKDLLDTLRSLTGKAKDVSVSDIQEAVGRRSFAPFLLVGALIVLSPIGGIPGVPTIFAVIVILTAGQMLIGRKSFWLPEVIANRSIEDKRLREGADSIEKPARWIDKFLKPRLTFLTDGPAAYVVALTCVALALTMPLLEAVPFAVAAPAAAIALFSLALVAHDGVLAIIGYLAAAGCIYVLSMTPIF